MAELIENLIRLKRTHGVGNVTIWRLLQHFGNSDAVYGASVRELTEVEGVSLAKAERILASSSHDPRPEIENAVHAGVDIIPYDDPVYPKPLLSTYDPPALLYVQGALVPDDQIAVGIVGTRRASLYGREQAERLAGELSRQGFTIVSGLALGIDTWAHDGALDAGGRTIGVLGCGFNHMYPPENRDLALEITRSGAVVTEFSMATKPSRETFPARNRIIAGWSLGVLVIEAPSRSGALITANQANNIGRQVFAVPGRIGDAASAGCNELIAAGATMVTGVDDILQALNPNLPPPTFSKKKRPARSGRFFDTEKKSGAPAPASSNRRRPETSARSVATGSAVKAESAGPASSMPIPTSPKFTPEQEQVLRAVGPDWLTIDDVTEAVGLPPERVAATLAMLKLIHAVEQGPAQTYRRCSGGR
ncbi:MAG: DNA-processing protein DprA [Planctomycetota bacterium]|jgi:DNA processing protein|nr:DNA-processing protein DprA [Planctomycetota bacterium]